MSRSESRSASSDASTPSPAMAYGAGSRFDDVWSLLTSDPYLELPIKRLRTRDLLRFLPTQLLRDARRTLSDQRDVLPTFEKLVHPVGIALRGVWTITEPNPYTGYFTQGSQALIIARASDALGEHRPGKLRFMGLAGKLYPTMDERHRMALHTANFFTLENLAGSHSRYFLHSTYGTDLLPPIPHVGAATKGPLAAVAATAFTLADRTLDPTRAAIRQLYPIAELGQRGTARAPTFMRLLGDDANPRCDAPDLRVELARALSEGAAVRFFIEVADGPSRYLPKSWLRIGHVHFTSAVASRSTDQRLHFTHPQYRSERPSVSS